MLRIHPEVLERFPGLHVVVAWADGLDNRIQRPGIDEALGAAWRSAAEAVAAHGNPQSHPRIAPWRERLRAVGAPPRDFPSSVEALARRAAKGGEPFHINPLVDFYNTISLRHLVPAGGFDLAAVARPVELRLTRGGERFAELGTAGEERVGTGEVAYVSGDQVLTRHFVWRQSEVAAITPVTTEALLLAEVLGEVGDHVAAAVLTDLADGLASLFGAGIRVGSASF